MIDNDIKKFLKTDMLNKDLVKLLENYMTKHDLRLYELAHKLGTTEATISRWLSNRNKIGKAWAQLIQIKLEDK